MIDFVRIGQAALRSATKLLQELYPAGELISSEFCVGDVNGAPGKSLSEYPFWNVGGLCDRRKGR
jgi:hypothetical protein